MTFLTLEEYLTDAKKIMLAQKCGFLVHDEDAVAHVAYRMMKADQTWDGSSKRSTWRYNQAKYAILRIVDQKKKERKRQIKSLDYGWDQANDHSLNTLAETVEDYRTSETELKNQFDEICELANKVLTGRRLECFNLYYKDGMTMEAIGQKLGCTRANVSLHVIKGTKEVKECMLQQN